ncbi:hypothetical protein OJF2_38540 [Aquisphaera giovannonii]|uniref:Uncharacterized protein n=1 Tax=Aquisphaera giovannonii TaxID=406548 RepID=A0A5B9W563_9BACT|nr:hypothetical protein OJF2_38540 [Aquisphaera giovannonii]
MTAPPRAQAICPCMGMRRLEKDRTPRGGACVLRHPIDCVVCQVEGVTDPRGRPAYLPRRRGKGDESDGDLMSPGRSLAATPG